MSFDVEKFKDEHECDEHWRLRRAFMLRWLNDYPEERLVCLARVFANIEFMGCQYPAEVMQEVVRLSQEVVKSYRESRKAKLKRTFVSASTAAEDRAKGVKRKGGLVEDATPLNKIQFVPQSTDFKETVVSSQSDDDDVEINNSSKTEDTPNTIENTNNINIDKIYEVGKDKCTVKTAALNEYLDEMMSLKCLDVRCFNEGMFQTAFGRMVLLVRPWADRISNIHASCQVCNISYSSTYENGILSVFINNCLIAQASGSTKAEAKSVAEVIAWKRLLDEVVSVLTKEQFIPQGDARVMVSDVTSGVPNKTEQAFGTPVENTLAIKMMKMMGWKGGGLGVDAQGIEEPIKPNLQLVNRAGLGSSSKNMQYFRKAALNLMQRYRASDTLDVDLVFSSDFSKEERALLHQVAKKTGLASKSYGGDVDRFLVVKKKLNPFSLVWAIIEKGGNTPKYQVFIPETLRGR